MHSRAGHSRDVRLPGPAHFGESNGGSGSKGSAKQSVRSSSGWSQHTLSRRLAAVLLITVILQTLRVYVSVEPLEFSKFRPISRAPLMSYTELHDEVPYEDAVLEDRVYYSQSPLGQRDCIGKVLAPGNSPVTVVTLVGKSGRDEHPGFVNFLKSLDVNGYDRLIALDPLEGLQEIRKLKRTNYSAEADFWFQRLKRFLAVAESLYPDNILLFCDALDVLFTQRPSVLVKRFVEMKKKVVFATEVLCDTVSCRTDVQLTNFLKETAPSGNPYRYLNAGMFMGRAKDIVEVLKCALQYSRDGRDDQTAFTMCYHLTRADGTIGLDFESKLFGNIPPAKALFDRSWSSYARPLINRTDLLPLITIHRRHLPNEISPVALHFLGMSYRRDLPFVPCQQFLRMKYNEISEMMSLSHQIHQSSKNTNIILMLTTRVWLLRISELATSPQNKSDGTQCHRVFSMLRGIKELKYSLSSIYSSSQGVRNADVRAIYVYVEIRLSTRIPPGVSNLENVFKFVSDITSCVDNEIQSLGIANGVLSSKVVLNRAVASVLAKTESESSQLFRDHEIRHANGLEWVLEMEKIRRGNMSTDYPLLLTFSGQHEYGSRVISSLLTSRLESQKPTAYGYSGLLLDIVPSSTDLVPRAMYLRSARHWGRSSQVVDVLSSEGGAVYDLKYFADFFTEFDTINSADDSCLFPYNLDAMLSRHLAAMGIPRVQLPFSDDFEIRSVDLLLPGIVGGVAPLTESDDGFACDKQINNLDIRTILPTEENSAQYSSVFQHANSIRKNILLCDEGKLLAKYIQLSWKRNRSTNMSELNPNYMSSNIGTEKRGRKIVRQFERTDNMVVHPAAVEEFRFCSNWLYSGVSFLPIPHVPDLSGFSWKQNWVMKSATSPCTCHLFTRVVDGQLFLGQGQYLGEGQYLSSRNGEYNLRLDKGARLCIYKVGELENISTRCLSAPKMTVKNAMVSGTNRNNFYIALQKGSVCFFSGEAPNFGGSALDSGHRELVWCTPDSKNNAEISRRLAPIYSDSALKNSSRQIAPISVRSKLSGMVKSICSKLDVSPRYFDDLFLMIESDATVGLYTSFTCKSSHELCSQEKRTEGTTLWKCFLMNDLY